MNTNQQLAKPSSFELELQSYEPQFAAALPGHISVEKFRRTVVTALNAQPDLAKADRRSLFTACVRAAQDGLFPDGREAALVIFNSKNQKTGEWVKQVQYMPMIGGIYKRMRNSGELASISAYVVFSNDSFDYELGDTPHINHKPAMGDRGQPIGAYAIAKLTNGEVLREVMSVSEIDKIRAASRSADKGPWVQWWEEMARKSVIRRLAKRLPGSADIDAMLQREDDQYAAAQPNGAAPRPTRAMFREPQITDVSERDASHDDGQWIDPPTGHDPETGEVEDDAERVTASELSLQAQGDAKCEEGLHALEAWWKGLTSAQRGELGARGRATGAYLEGWKIRAIAADERGGAAPEEDDEPPFDASGGIDAEVTGATQEQMAEGGANSTGTPGPTATNGASPSEPPMNWTAWAREIIDDMRDADEDALIKLSVLAATEAAKCPPHVMKDIDIAYRLRRGELENGSAAAPRF
jgi:recombination protein RecT